MSAPTELRLYNTLSRSKEAFSPLDAANVRMYVCGPTVYDFAHIGNARPPIVFDVLFRLLCHLYGEAHVTYVSNVTDVDDKINARAFERWSRKRPLLAEMRELTESTNAQYRKDLNALNVLLPTHTPRATDFVCDGEKPLDMIRVIQKLVDKGHAYAAEGHVLFHVPSMPDYGRLSRRTLDDMIAGARVDVAPYKRDPMDFVLWKPSDPETEPGWDSPFGFGRPGWHIECSAMARALLGESFDIHGGGIDLVFPHHENEIAQTCCAFGVEKMASIWMHNGFLQVEGQKMSKSLGNFVTISELLETDRFGGRKWPGAVLRLAMLKTHYRQPIDWTVRSLEEAEATLLSWSEVADLSAAQPPADVLAALGDDLNTAEVLALMHGFRKRGNGQALGAAMALLGLSPLKRAASSLTVDETAVAALITARLDARKAKNFAESDRIRDELAAMGVVLKDGKDAAGQPITSWELKR
jgi:cysteinyl-tRNA synthetase